MKKLSSQELISFKENGAIVIKNAINKETVRSVLSKIYNIFIKECDKDLEYDSLLDWLNKNDQSLLYKLHLKTSKRKIFYEIEKQLSLIFKQLVKKEDYRIIEDNPSFLLGLPKDSRLIYDWHQECNYMKNIHPIITAHFPLNATCNYKNGAMSYLERTNNLGPLEYEKQTIKNGYTNLKPIMMKDIQEDYELKQPNLELGDCLFFDEFLIHKSNFNSSDSPRSVGIFRITSLDSNYNFIK